MMKMADYKLGVSKTGYLVEFLETETKPDWNRVLEFGTSPRPS